MPRFEQYPLASSVPSDAIFLYADPNDLNEDGNPIVKRIPAELLPTQQPIPTAYTIEANPFGTTVLPAGTKSGDNIFIEGNVSSSINSVTFQGGFAGAPSEGTILIIRNEQAGSAVTIETGSRITTLQGNNVVLEGDNKGFATFYVRRYGQEFELQQVGGGFY